MHRGPQSTVIPHLRKLLLVSAVVILFALYVIQERPQSIALDPKSIALLPSSTPVVRPASPTTTPSPTAPPPSPTPQPTEQLETPTVPPVEQAQTTVVPPTATIVPPTATATDTPVPPTETPVPEQNGAYLDGTYTGSEEDAHWGYLYVVVTVSNGELVDVQIPEYPNHRNRSVEINDQALPWLIEEAIQAQSADIDMISGATDTSRAFIRSLDTALQQAAR